MPRIGGIALFLATLVSLLLLFFHESAFRAYAIEHADLFIGLLIGAGTVMLIGLVDDLLGIQPWLKLLGTIVAAVIVSVFGLAVKSITVPVIGNIHLGWMAVPVAVIWVLGCCHAVNLSDGMDGLAGGVGVIMAGTLFALSLRAGNIAPALIAAAIAGVCVGFLIFNRHPASIFLGDCGSLFLGFSLGALCFIAAKRHAAVAVSVVAVIFGIPILDTLAAVVRRWSRRLPISAADRQHIHHRLLQMGLSQRQAVLVLYAACTALGLLAIYLAVSPAWAHVLVLGLLVFMALVIMRFFGWLSLGRIIGKVRRDVRRSCAKSRIWSAIAEMSNEMDELEDISRLPEIMDPVLRHIGVDRCTIRFENGSDDATARIEWKKASASALGTLKTRRSDPAWNGSRTSVWRSSYDVTVDDERRGHVEIEKRGNIEDLPSDISYIIVRITEIVGRHPAVLDFMPEESREERRLTGNWLRMKSMTANGSVKRKNATETT